jgi:very-short-patch-repair endonuclease
MCWKMVRNGTLWKLKFINGKSSKTLQQWVIPAQEILGVVKFLAQIAILHHFAIFFCRKCVPT